MLHSRWGVAFHVAEGHYYPQVLANIIAFDGLEFTLMTICLPLHWACGVIFGCVADDKVCDKQCRRGTGISLSVLG